MGTAASPIDTVLEDIGTIAGGAAQVMPGSANQITRVTGYVGLGIEGLQLLESLFTTIAGIFHHAHTTVSMTQPPASLAPAPPVAQAKTAQVQPKA